MSGDATTLLTSQFGAAAACAYLLNLIQRAKSVPQITKYTDRINFFVRLGLAFASTIGISFVWNPTDHSLLITGLSAVTIIQGIWHVFTQYAMTHTVGKVLDTTHSSEPSDK